MLHDELVELAAPVLRKVLDHPFWSGLRDGSLPGEALVHFVEQDTGHLLPAYGRALARCAATAHDDAHAVFFARAAVGTLEARNRLREEFTGLLPRLGLPAPSAHVPADPLAHAHCAFFHAAAATSLAAGAGAVLPMAWFNLQVSKDLAERRTRGSVYEPWIELYQPSEGYARVVERYLAVVDEIGEQCSAREREQLVESFQTGIRHEWAFAESAWQRPAWPV
uniref:Putative transcriptional regulator, TNENA/THI-4 family n=1 Tax=Streptomyces tendae TaxID=1932 RepID=A7DWJ5_STRTE|nr:putative transcriptional regulator, TNENA/THI-4 family [Streptomyces tendae]